ncbi:hypothetical protein ElyMa_001063200 [Elysia marginata]|uniref:Uncharacterized protein n=1 Tax=Elysia marginata TaxID=1093978 RepID=A0AAV4HRQ7_9GAST|nr:hypothetical protein ElyMa_001063200 [Elysia marginata]
MQLFIDWMKLNDDVGDDDDDDDSDDGDDMMMMMSALAEVIHNWTSRSTVLLPAAEEYVRCRSDQYRYVSLTHPAPSCDKKLVLLPNSPCFKQVATRV